MGNSTYGGIFLPNTDAPNLPSLPYLVSSHPEGYNGMFLNKEKLLFCCLGKEKSTIKYKIMKKSAKNMNLFKIKFMGE
jgi:hypothetical protein